MEPKTIEGVCPFPARRRLREREETDDVYDLRLIVRAHPGSRTARGRASSCTDNPCPQPLLRLHERSISARAVGFPVGATLYGKDGTVNVSNAHFVPPFVAPNVHALDHPDYVLIFLEDAKSDTTLMHRYGDDTKYPFAKLVLYPLVREERMLPRDAYVGADLTSSDTLRTQTEARTASWRPVLAVAVLHTVMTVVLSLSAVCLDPLLSPHPHALPLPSRTLAVGPGSRSDTTRSFRAVLRQRKEIFMTAVSSWRGAPCVLW